MLLTLLQGRENSAHLQFSLDHSIVRCVTYLWTDHKSLTLKTQGWRLWAFQRHLSIRLLRQERQSAGQSMSTKGRGKYSPRPDSYRSPASRLCRGPSQLDQMLPYHLSKTHRQVHELDQACNKPFNLQLCTFNDVGIIMTPCSLIFFCLSQRLQVSTVGTNSKWETVDTCAMEIHSIDLVVTSLYK